MNAAQVLSGLGRSLGNDCRESSLSDRSRLPLGKPNCFGLRYYCQLPVKDLKLNKPLNRSDGTTKQPTSFGCKEPIKQGQRELWVIWGNWVMAVLFVTSPPLFVYPPP